MKKFTWFRAFLVLFSVLFLAACGTEKSDENDSDSGEPMTEETETNGEEVAEMKPAIEQINDNTYRYSLVNNTGEVQTFEFTSSQRFDFSLTNDSGEVAFLFSSVSTYAQALGEERVDDGDKLSYDLEIPPLDLEPGTYELAAWLTPRSGNMYKVTTDHIVK
ncbi:intracellular proteinase inhibitor (BsuPI) [Planococcus halocryophilus Or1]|uniref:Intracellular proteinase inhibitor (BsuPI) n=1 Tax=Planococcus halocryophilus TaxID=1215089 RepID=A0A1C7DUZ5_9BACL|nr:BsuPI-related putative proteinase inhibitor [Planococcus halocryophilus]ANU15326.1 intracellular proteinase inhibitor (BsuPI) [Planococcus halocryophilus]EMF47687.1 intracellular proteinase inhibitor (BsuPI) [Planococcus halocryophilus Or1]